MSGKFDFKRGNVLASLAESMTEYLKSIYNLEHQPFKPFRVETNFFPPNDVKPVGTVFH